MTTSYDALPGGSASGGFWSAETASASSDWTVTPTPISFHHAEMNSALWLYVVDDDGTTIFRLIGLPSWSSRAPVGSRLYPGPFSFSPAASRSEVRTSDGSRYHRPPHIGGGGIGLAGTPCP